MHNLSFLQVGQERKKDICKEQRTQTKRKTSFQIMFRSLAMWQVGKNLYYYYLFLISSVIIINFFTIVLSLYNKYVWMKSTLTSKQLYMLIVF